MNDDHQKMYALEVKKAISSKNPDRALAILTLVKTNNKMLSAEQRMDLLDLIINTIGLPEYAYKLVCQEKALFMNERRSLIFFIASTRHAFWIYEALTTIENLHYSEEYKLVKSLCECDIRDKAFIEQLCGDGHIQLHDISRTLLLQKKDKLDGKYVNLTSLQYIEIVNNSF